MLDGRLEGKQEATVFRVVDCPCDVVTGKGA